MEKKILLEVRSNSPSFGQNFWQETSASIAFAMYTSLGNAGKELYVG